MLVAADKSATLFNIYQFTVFIKTREEQMQYLRPADPLSVW